MISLEHQLYPLMGSLVHWFNWSYSNSFHEEFDIVFVFCLTDFCPVTAMMCQIKATMSFWKVDTVTCFALLMSQMTREISCLR